MIQLCAGLGAAHNASIYHRDIKPGNIFVRADGILKILDFGVARLASSSMTAAGFIVGTPDYMSPEQARGADIDGRSDIFSLGGVFYFMLTGRKPFPATELPSLFHQIQNDDPPPLLDSGSAARAGGGDHEGALEEAGDAVSDLSGAAGRPGQPSGSGIRSQRRAPQRAPTGARPIADRHAGRAAPNRRRRPAAPADAAPPSTDDTVDSCRSAAFNSDDTVTLEPPPTWVKRVTGRIDSAVSGAFARVGGPPPRPRPRPTGMRKR